MDDARNGSGVRQATTDDWAAIWPIWREIVAAGQTYDFDPGTDESTARAIWMKPPPGRTYVAEAAGTVAGTATLASNRLPGLGDHIANASYMVSSPFRGRGIGRALATRTIQDAGELGFHGIQFNAVAASNTGAVRLYQDLGFQIVGTVPEAFRQAGKGLVDFHVMYRRVCPPDDCPHTAT